MTISVKPCFVGIDVGKYDLVLAVHGAQEHLTFANTGDGIAALTSHLLSHPLAVQIALEATGGYEWPLWEALDAAGLFVRQVPPAHVRAFARSCGARAKTDRIDAQILAAFAALRPDAGRSMHDRSLRDLRALKQFAFTLICSGHDESSLSILVG
jgi:transposase